jgi:hypothetical protein
MLIIFLNLMQIQEGNSFLPKMQKKFMIKPEFDIIFIIFLLRYLDLS